MKGENTAPVGDEPPETADTGSDAAARTSAAKGTTAKTTAARTGAAKTGAAGSGSGSGSGAAAGAASMRGEDTAIIGPDGEVKTPKGGKPPKTPKPPKVKPLPGEHKTVPVRPRTLVYLVLAIVVLLVLLGGLFYAKVVHGTTAPSAAPAAKPSASTSARAKSTPPAVPTQGPSPTDAFGAPSPSPTGVPSATLAAPGSTFSPLTGSQFLGAPIDGVAAVTEPVDVDVSAVNYPGSVTFECATQTLIDWNVAGHSTFTTTVGIPDTAQNATGVTDVVTFKDENGNLLDTVRASIGQPQAVSFSVSGVERLTVSCVRQGSATAGGDNVVALGSASIAD